MLKNNGFHNRKRLRPVLGPELVTNGDFSNGTTGWASGTSTLTIVNGEAELGVTGAGGSLNQNVAVTSGKNYLFAYTIRKGTFTGATFGRIASNGVPSASIPLSPSSVTSQVIFVASASSVSVAFGRLSADTGTVYFDNISIRELLSGG